VGEQDGRHDILRAGTLSLPDVQVHDAGAVTRAREKAADQSNDTRAAVTGADILFLDQSKILTDTPAKLAGLHAAVELSPAIRAAIGASFLVAMHASTGGQSLTTRLGAATCRRRTIRRGRNQRPMQNGKQDFRVHRPPPHHIRHYSSGRERGQSA
jgi:hypothetical protein